jgi:hypothetical protein
VPLAHVYRRAQTLPALSTADVLLVALVSGVSEELLFRCALLPAVGADWRGVLVAGAVFGALHVNGGRNAAFAVWAAAVGVGYGALAVALADGSAPMLAHAAANAAGALLWRAANEDKLAAARGGALPAAAPAAQAPASRAAADRPAWWREGEDS